MLLTRVLHALRVCLQRVHSGTVHFASGYEVPKKATLFSLIALCKSAIWGQAPPLRARLLTRASCVEPTRPVVVFAKSVVGLLCRPATARGSVVVLQCLVRRLAEQDLAQLLDRRGLQTAPGTSRVRLLLQRPVLSLAEQDLHSKLLTVTDSTRSTVPEPEARTVQYHVPEPEEGLE